MSSTVDARGLACPQPVILTKRALKEENRVTVIVDNETARKNVTMLAKKQGAAAQVEEKEDGIYITLNAGGGEKPAAAEKSDSAGSVSLPSESAYIVVIPGESMGRGDDELGKILVRGFFHALTEQDRLPEAVVFFNTGVRYVVRGSEVLEDLRALEEKGVSILACGTCLGQLELKDSVAVGSISNMYTIVETMIEADKIIQL